MSLVKSPRMTEKKVAATRRNQKHSHTAGGRERIRAALLRHGYDVQAEEVAMRALGEDPAQFQELLEVLWEEWNPSGGLQEGLVIQLAQATWLMNRAIRMQEGYAVRQAQEVNSGRADRLHAKMMRLTLTAETLGRLVQSVAQKHYVTPGKDLEKMKNLHQEGVLKDMGEIALALFYQLQAPGTGEDGIDPHEAQRRVLQRVKEIFGLAGDTPPQVKVAPGFRQTDEKQQNAQAGGGPDVSPAPADVAAKSGQVPVRATQLEENDQRYPNITAAEWEAREGPRQLLENILTRYVDICEAQRKAILKESVKGPSPYERAAEIAPTHPDAPRMRKLQDSCFREVRRVTNLLLKLKRYEYKMATFRGDPGENDAEENGE
jgi:hypothetical protein